MLSCYLFAQKVLGNRFIKSINFYNLKRRFMLVFFMSFEHFTAISKKVVLVNSQYWDRKELWGSSSTNNSSLLASTLQDIECRFII